MQPDRRQPGFDRRQGLSGPRAADFRRTFAKLRTLRADVFLSFHPGVFDMDAKRAKLLAGDSLAFVDRGRIAASDRRRRGGVRH
ncbi:MAG: hypothetical protein WDN44_04215 [Sphingomonas sp.]